MGKYWIVISHWSLIDSMATECISPHSFYSSRCYGSDLSRFIEGSERVNHLMLYSDEPKGDYVVEVDESLLDKKMISPVGKQKTVFKYPRSIFYQKGKVRFRFASEDLLKSFLAETEIMLEVKCTRLYINDFYISDTGNSIKQTGAEDCLALEDQHHAIIAEDRYNYIKGAILGYARGQVTARMQTDIEALAALDDLKNTFGGLHTRLMIDDTYEPVADLIEKISMTETLYNIAGHRRTNNFEVIQLIYKDLIKIAGLRYNVLQSYKGPDMKSQLEQLERDIAICEREVSQIELQNNIYQIIGELESIKRAEEEKGKAIGKERLYFKKGTPERERKEYLKSIIEDFKQNNREYSTKVGELKRLKDKASSMSMGTTEYDGALAPMFIKLSDAIENIVDRIEKSSVIKTIDLSRLSMTAEGYLFISGNNEFSDAELEYYNILLAVILEKPLKDLRPVSDMDVIDLLEKSCKIYVDTGKTSKSEEGRCVKNVLVSFWLYKKHDPRGKIILPDNLPLIKNVIAFFVKCSDFAQIERYATNKGIMNKEYAIMLWAAFVGYASLPRTMTNEVYGKFDRYQPVESFICSLKEYDIRRNSASIRF